MKPTCCGDVVESSALGSTYWYCRGCKGEVTADSAPESISFESTQTLEESLAEALANLQGGPYGVNFNYAPLSTDPYASLDDRICPLCNLPSVVDTGGSSACYVCCTQWWGS